MGFSFEQFAGAKHTSYTEWLEAWMRPDTGDTKLATTPVFSRDAILDVDLAFDLGLLSQAALVALGPKRLRQAGAFRANRTTDTTVLIGG